MRSDHLSTQYQTLALYGSGHTLRYVRVGMFCAAIGFLAVGTYASAPWAYMLAAFLGISGLSVWEQTRFWEAACRAAEAGTSTPALVTVSTSSWSDSVHYHALVRDPAGNAWKFEFMPLKWTPTEGEFRALIYSLPSMRWPPLVETDAGLIFPRYKPVELPRE